MKHLRIITVAVLIIGIMLPYSVFGAIAFQLGVDGLNVNPGTTLAWNHDITGATDPIIFAWSSARDATQRITGITWNTNEDFTKIGEVLDDENNDFASLWYIIPVAIGNHEIKMTSSASRYLTGSSASYTGAASTQVDILTNAEVVTQTAGGSLESFATSTVDNSWFVLGQNTLLDAVGGAVCDAGAGSELRVINNDIHFCLHDNNQAVTPPARISMTVIISGGAGPNAIGTVMTAFEPALPPIVDNIGGIRMGFGF